jgi:hypothetical protein
MKGQGTPRQQRGIWKTTSMSPQKRESERHVLDRPAGLANAANPVIASAAKQSIYPRAEVWIASLRSQ